MSLVLYVADSRMRHDSINSRLVAPRVDLSTLSTTINRFRLNLMRQNNFRIFKEQDNLSTVT